MSGIGVSARLSVVCESVSCVPVSVVYLDKTHGPLWTEKDYSSPFIILPQGQSPPAPVNWGWLGFELGHVAPRLGPLEVGEGADEVVEEPDEVAEEVARHVRASVDPVT